MIGVLELGITSEVEPIMSDAKHIAEILLDLKAVSISPRQPFTWASGLRSPLYCDNRLIISAVVERRAVTQAFVTLFKQRDWQPNVIAGTATAGIPHAAWIADTLSLPMVYIRGAEKQHGKQNRIEGRLPEDAQAVVIEDLISTGGSSVSAALALADAGARIQGVAAIFSYGMDKATRCFADAQLNHATLCNLEALLSVAQMRGDLDSDEVALVKTWSQDPITWSQRHG